MKPQNKLQKRVVEVSGQLAPATGTQIQWAHDHCFEHIGRRTSKGVITCTKCGHSWQGEGELINTLLGCECPHCHARLSVKTTRKRVFKQVDYFCIITKCKEFQVLRYFMVQHEAKIGEKTRYSFDEVMQRWIAPNGKYATFARLRQSMGSIYCDSWIIPTKLELRAETWVYNQIYARTVYPRQQVIPELKRAGYRKNLYGLVPFELFRALLTENKIETLLKTGQTELLRYFVNNGGSNINRYWRSICICNRNGYKVEDAHLWCDYLDFLDYTRKDLHNAKYVCPLDLKKEHEKYEGIKAKMETQREKEEDFDFSKKEKAFKKRKKRFFGLHFSDGVIQVRVLESIEELIFEGKKMHHCVGNYYDKEDSLILSATIGDKKIETVEVSLCKLQVTQCRGACNKNTLYHDRIVELVKENMNLIQKRICA